MPNVKKMLAPRTNSEIKEMHSELIVFLSEGGYQYVDENDYIKVQIPMLKIVDGVPGVTPAKIIEQ